jgi:hypothetical protein
MVPSKLRVVVLVVAFVVVKQPSPPTPSPPPPNVVNIMLVPDMVLGGVYA